MTISRSGIAAFLISGIVATCLLIFPLKHFTADTPHARKIIHLSSSSLSSGPSQPSGPTIQGQFENESYFDFSIPLGIDPLGIVWSSGNFIVANRNAPGG